MCESQEAGNTSSFLLGTEGARKEVKDSGLGWEDQAGLGQMSYPVFEVLHFDDLGCQCEACGSLHTPVHLAKPAPTEMQGHSKPRI